MLLHSLSLVQPARRAVTHAIVKFHAPRAFLGYRDFGSKRVSASNSSKKKKQNHKVGSKAATQAMMEEERRMEAEWSAYGLNEEGDHNMATMEIVQSASAAKTKKKKPESRRNRRNKPDQVLEEWTEQQLKAQEELREQEPETQATEYELREQEPETRATEHEHNKEPEMDHVAAWDAIDEDVSGANLTMEEIIDRAKAREEAAHPDKHLIDRMDAPEVITLLADFALHVEQAVKDDHENNFNAAYARLGQMTSLLEPFSDRDFNLFRNVAFERYVNAREIEDVSDMFDPMHKSRRKLYKLRQQDEYMKHNDINPYGELFMPPKPTLLLGDGKDIHHMRYLAKQPLGFRNSDDENQFIRMHDNLNEALIRETREDILAEYFALFNSMFFSNTLHVDFVQFISQKEMEAAGFSHKVSSVFLEFHKDGADLAILMNEERILKHKHLIVALLSEMVRVWHLTGYASLKEYKLSDADLMNEKIWTQTGHTRMEDRMDYKLERIEGYFKLEHSPIAKLLNKRHAIRRMQKQAEAAIPLGEEATILSTNDIYGSRHADAVVRVLRKYLSDLELDVWLRTPGDNVIEMLQNMPDLDDEVVDKVKMDIEKLPVTRIGL